MSNNIVDKNLETMAKAMREKGSSICINMDTVGGEYDSFRSVGDMPRAIMARKIARKLSELSGMSVKVKSCAGAILQLEYSKLYFEIS